MNELEIPQRMSDFGGKSPQEIPTETELVNRFLGMAQPRRIKVIQMIVGKIEK